MAKHAESGKNRPLRILHVFWRLERGGAELRTVELLRAVDNDLYQMGFCSFSGQPGVLDTEILALGGQVHYCRRGLLFPFRFSRLLRAHRYEIVHSHIGHWGIVLLLAWFAGVPGRIAHFRSPQTVQDAPWPRRILEGLLKLLVKASATHVLGVSESTLAAVWGRVWSKDKRFQVIYNGLDLTPYREEPDRGGVFCEFSVPPTSRLYIHVGRFYPVKNHSKLLAVFAEIVRSGAPAYLLLVGKGMLQSQIEREIVELGLSDRVILAGLRADVPRLLKAADLMIFPSLWEGLPGAVLEAVAAGVPVLASKLPPVEEIQRHLEGISTLELSESNSVWAAKAMHLAESRRPTDPIAAFEKSPFSLERSRLKFCAVWDDAARAT